MLFNTYIFFIFLGLVLSIFLLLKNQPKLRMIWVLMASYFFYGYWEWKFLGLILLSTGIDYYSAKSIHQTSNKPTKRIWLLLSLFTNLGILIYFKYANFFLDSFTTLLTQLGTSFSMPVLEIILPVGISFYTFQTMSYTIDVYRGKVKAETDFLNFALFVTFFPQLVAGPIERAEHILNQFKGKFYPSKQQFKDGLKLIVLGLFKKVMIGDSLGRLVDEIFTSPTSFNSLELFAAVVLFGFQIYADFSGYSQIARGTAKLLGVELMKNFTQPYLSLHITEFWRRWHISLSSWLKDYLYISLGGNRVGRTKLNLFLTMLLGGLWHGANWTFVVWGFLHGLYLSIHKYILKQSFTVPKGVSWLCTQFLVFYAWLYFRANSIEDAFYIQKRILNFEVSQEGWYLVKTLCVMGVLLFGLDWFERWANKPSTGIKPLYKPIYYGALSTMGLISFMYMFQNKALPFIYFQF